MTEFQLGINAFMPSFYAKRSHDPIRIGIVLFDRTKLLDVCGPLQVFNDARTQEGTRAYAVDLVSELGGPVETDTGVALETRSFAQYSQLPADTLLVSGGDSALEAARSPVMQDFLADAATACRRFGSICLGAFILAGGGFLNGRRATTHWEGCRRLADSHPFIEVQENAIFVEDRGIWTSAGVTAGIDMALAMVEEDLGRPEALRIAKALVLPVRRTGGQSQFSAALATQLKTGDGKFAKLISRILEDLTQDLTVPKLAAMVCMSERNFSRVFTASLSVSPARFVERLRVDHACEILQRGDASLADLPQLAGFSNAEQMRRAFQRNRGISPSDYKARFGPA
jgi:transcriptional regulator GlxA family with amidase domain